MNFSMLAQISADYYRVLNNLQECQSHLLTYISMLEIEVDTLNATIETIKFANRNKNQIYEDNLLEIVKLQQENLLLQKENELLKSTNAILADQNVNFLLGMNLSSTL